jgi:hypothetical protein
MERIPEGFDLMDKKNAFEIGKELGIVLAEGPDGIKWRDFDGHIYDWCDFCGFYPEGIHDCSHTAMIYYLPQRNMN